MDEDHPSRRKVFESPQKPELKPFNSQVNISDDEKPAFFDFYPVAVRAIENDDLEKIQTLISIDSLSRESIDKLVYKACERSKDITLEEESIKKNHSVMDTTIEHSMLSQCLTARKKNEQLIDILIDAENIKSKMLKCRTEPRISKTPQKPPLVHSVDRNTTGGQQKSIMTTPKRPSIKSAVRRTLKFD